MESFGIDVIPQGYSQLLLELEKYLDSLELKINKQDVIINSFFKRRPEDEFLDNVLGGDVGNNGAINGDGGNHVHGSILASGNA